ncbi:MAG: nitronate monooxygenase [Dehalococcoidales bacterium]|nr:nitronate monooxygenase [Dehalococcoidales bacterium]
MIKTRITELFGIKHPIMLAGMNWVTEPGIVSAVCNAGALGVFATAHCTPEETRKNIQEIRKLTDKPFGVNVMLNLPTAKGNVEAILAEKVPIVNYALGKPYFIEQVHAYGGKVIGTIAKAKHAAMSEKLGVDAMSITGHEAAAHGMEATSMILIPIVTSWSKVPLIAAGGFYDGRGLAAALSLGADAVSMGTRFMITKENPVHENLKKFCLAASEEDTVYSDVFDGLPSRVMRNKASLKLLKGDFPLFSSFASALRMKKLLKLSTWDMMRTSVGMMNAEEKRNLLDQARFANMVILAEKAIYQGDVENGIIIAGQSCGGIKDKELPTCKEVIEESVAQAEAILKKLGTQVV